MGLIREGADEIIGQLVGDLTDTKIPKFDSAGNKLVDSAITENANEVKISKKLNIPAGSASLGEALEISEGTANLVIVDLLKNKMAFSVNSDFSVTTGSSKPSAFDFGDKFILNISLDETQTLTDNPLIFQLTGTVVAPEVRVIAAITLRTGGAMTNFRAKITDNATGTILRHIPSESAFDGDVPGLDLVLGDNTFFLVSNAADTPGNFNLGFTPFIIEPGQLIDFEIVADSVNIKGDVSGVPRLIADAHDGPLTDLAKASEVIAAQNTADLSGSPLTAIDDQIFPTNLADVVTDGTFCVRNTPADVAAFGLADHVDGDVLKKVGAIWKRLIRPVAGTTFIWQTVFGKAAVFFDDPVAGGLPVFVNTLVTGEAFSLAYIGTNLPGQTSFDGTLLIGNNAGGLTTADFGNATVLIVGGSIPLWIRDTVNPERSGVYNLIVNNAGTGDYTLRRDYNFRSSDSFTDGQTFFVGGGTGGDEANKNYLISLTQQFAINTTSLAIVEGTIANSSQVPTVEIQEFASDIIRFFGEFGLPTTTPNSIWTLINGAEVTLVQDNFLGNSQQVVNVKDTNAGIGTSIENSISPQQWQDAFDFGAEFGGIIKAISPAGSNNYFFIGAGVSGANNPTASSADQRFGAFFKKDPSTNFIVVDDLQGPTNVVLDGTGGLPLVESGDYFEAFVAADVNFTDPRWIVNGIDVGAATFGNNSNSNNVIHIQSGSSSGVGNDFNVVNFGITILKESTTKTFSAAAMAADIIDVITPLIVRDFENILPDGFPRPVNAKINGTLNNVGGKYKIRTENLSSPQSLFNELRELEKDVTKTGDKISLSNVLDNNNVYFGEFEQFITYEHSGLISSGVGTGPRGMSIIDATTFRIETIKAVIVDRSLNTFSPKQTFIDLPQTDHVITGGGDQIVNTYINAQGVFEFRAAEPTSFSVTGEIFIGKAVMDAGVITVAVFTPNVAYTGSVDGQAELINVGGHKTKGSIMSAGGANLTLSVTAGNHHQIGRGFLVDVNSPNLCETEARAVIAFTGTTGNLFLVHADAGGNFIIDSFISSSANPDIDPVQFNSGGTLAAVPVNDVTAMRVYQACGTNDIIVYYGDVAYANMAAAEAGFEGEDPEILTTRDISYICTILVKETVTDLTAGVIAGDVIFKNRSGDREL